MARSALAVLGARLIFSVGAVLIFQFSGRDPRVYPERGFLLLSVAGGVAFALVAGYAAGAIARRAEILARRHSPHRNGHSGRDLDDLQTPPRFPLVGNGRAVSDEPGGHFGRLVAPRA